MERVFITSAALELLATPEERDFLASILAGGGGNQASVTSAIAFSLLARYLTSAADIRFFSKSSILARAARL